MKCRSTLDGLEELFWLAFKESLFVSFFESRLGISKSKNKDCEDYCTNEEKDHYELS